MSKNLVNAHRKRTRLRNKFLNKTEQRLMHVCFFIRNRFIRNPELGIFK